MAGFAAPLTDTKISEETVAEIEAIFADKYKVIVHNDDVTTFATVITALVRLFDHSPEEAENLANKVHTEGKAVVALLPEEEAQLKVEGLHSYKINASKERD